MTKTVLELDLVGYSTIADMLEQGLGVETSPQLNRQIQSFVDQGLQSVKLTRDATVMQTTGDGAILVFDKPSLAHVFANAVHQATRTHNATKDADIGKRIFRIGIATGDLVMEPKANGGFDIGGMTIARAVRLEAKARPGEVLCDPETFAGLTAKQQKLYSARETVTGKRDETFPAHRCVMNPNGVKDAACFTHEKEVVKPATVLPKQNHEVETPPVRFSLTPITDPASTKVSRPPATVTGSGDEPPDPQATSTQTRALEEASVGRQSSGEGDVAFRKLRDEAIKCLRNSPGAIDILANNWSRKIKLSLDGVDDQNRCERVVDALLGLGVADAVRVMVLGYLEAADRHGRGDAKSEAIEKLCYHVLPVIYRPEELRQVRAKILNSGDALVSLPVTYKTSVEMIMAGVDGRKIKLRTPSSPKDFPPGEPLLHELPESGLDQGGSLFAADFQRHLVEKLLPPGSLNLLPDSLPAAISALLEIAVEIDGYRYYYIYTLPQDPAVRRRRHEIVEALKGKFPSIVFFGLERSPDPVGELQILDLFNRLLCRAAGVEWKR
jgi:class 3 adenylate cyclase